jgi:signal transduction histidine kinase
MSPLLDSIKLLRQLQPDSLKDLYRSSEDPNAFRFALRRLLGLVHPSLAVEAIALVLFDGLSEHFRIVAHDGLKDSGQLMDETMATSLTHLLDSLFPATKVSNEPYIWNELSPCSADQSLRRVWSDALPSARLKNVMLIPFASDLECQAVLCLLNSVQGATAKVSPFSRGDLQKLTIARALIYLAVSHAWVRKVQDITTASYSKLLGDALATTPIGTDEIYDEIARVAGKLANASAAILYTFLPGEPAYLSLSGMWGLKRRHSVLSRFHAKASIAGTVALTGDPRVIHDLESAEGVANREVGQAEDFKSCLVVPVGKNGGALVVFSRRSRHFGNDTLHLIGQYARFSSYLFLAIRGRNEGSNLGTRAAIVGHSVRGPLSKVAQGLDIIKTQLVDGASHARLLALLGPQIEELALGMRRIDSLLYASSASVGSMGLNKERIRLEAIIRASQKRVQPEADRRRIPLVIHPTVSRLPAVDGDREKLELAFDNLIENAVKYSSPFKSVEILGEETSSQIRILVRDEGIGVPVDQYDEIFKGFARSSILDEKRFIPGTGLGLFIVKTIIEAHHGTVKVNSKPPSDDKRRKERYEGYETVFTVALPKFWHQ